jgi:hypothetical protein
MGERFGVSIGLLIAGLGTAGGCGKSEVPSDEEPPDWAACELHSDCVLAADSCCGTCGEPVLGDVDAVNHRLEQEHFSDVCPEPVPCPSCPFSRNPDLHATCDDRVCLALDIREHSVSVCDSDDDCRLRVTGCCECGGSTEPWDLISLRRDGETAYQELVCDAGQGCDDCLPSYPSNVVAVCAADGHCAAVTGAEAGGTR